MRLQEFSVYRTRMLRSGIVETKGYGQLSFTLPRFDVYIRNQRF